MNKLYSHTAIQCLALTIILLTLGASKTSQHIAAGIYSTQETNNLIALSKAYGYIKIFLSQRGYRAVRLGFFLSVWDRGDTGTRQ